VQDLKEVKLDLLATQRRIATHLRLLDKLSAGVEVKAYQNAKENNDEETMTNLSSKNTVKAYIDVEDELYRDVEVLNDLSIHYSYLQLFSCDHIACSYEIEEGSTKLTTRKCIKCGLDINNEFKSKYSDIDWKEKDIFNSILNSQRRLIDTSYVLSGVDFIACKKAYEYLTWTYQMEISTPKLFDLITGIISDSNSIEKTKAELSLIKKPYQIIPTKD